MKISQNLLTRIEKEAIKAYPKESCGFLVGLNGQDIILDAVPSQNLAKKEDEFQVDAALHLCLQRDLRENGHTIIGIYHSHPAGDSHPSPRDLISINETNLVWMITSVAMDTPPETRIFSRFNAETGQMSRTFDEKPLQITRFVA